MKFDFIISFLILSCHCFTFLVSGAIDSTCPKPKVRKQTIIKPNISMDNGAKLLYMKKVQKAHQCYDLCCKERECNTAVMHYKQVDDETTGETIITKQCFLFACGSPSVCSFDEHGKYAVIELPGKDVAPVIATEPPAPEIATTPEKVVEIESQPKPKQTECPPGVPMPMCSKDVCLTKTCPAHPKATCKMNFCGGCFHDFFLDGKKVDCDNFVKQESAVPSAQVAEPTTVKQEESSIGSGAKEETNNIKPKTDVEDTASVVPMESNEEAVLVSVEDVEEAPEETIPGEEPKKEDKPKKEEEDPYFQTERRKWLDTRTVEPKTTERKASEPPREQPPTASGTQNVIVTTIRESTLLSVPLLVALIVCLLLLFVIVYRLKCAKRGKPKKFQVDDGDYLINGMYL